MHRSPKRSSRRLRVAPETPARHSRVPLGACSPEQAAQGSSSRARRWKPRGLRELGQHVGNRHQVRDREDRSRPRRGRRRERGDGLRGATDSDGPHRAGPRPSATPPGPVRSPADSAGSRGGSDARLARPDLWGLSGPDPVAIGPRRRRKDPLVRRVHHSGVRKSVAIRPSLHTRVDEQSSVVDTSPASAFCCPLSGTTSDPESRIGGH